jgi:hypothetical protein
MSNSKQIKCPITGQITGLGKDYYQKKVEDYGSEENFSKYYVCNKAKKLITRGYNVDEIRKILNVTEQNLLDSKSLEMREIVTFHDKGKSENLNRRLESSLNFNMQSSDPDVAEFINNIIKQYET